MNALFFGCRGSVSVSAALGVLATLLMCAEASAQKRTVPSRESAQTRMQSASMGVEASPMAAVISRQPYQAELPGSSFACGADWCEAAFPRVPGNSRNRRLELKNISCTYGIDNGSFTWAYIAYQVTVDPNVWLSHDLASEWQRTNGVNTLHTFGRQTAFFVPGGKQLWVVSEWNGSITHARCQVFGELVTLG